MLTGVYDRSVKMTPEERKKRNAEACAKYRAKNREKHRKRKAAQTRRYYAENRDKVLAYKKRYAELNREAIRENKRKRYAENREIVTAKQKQYRNENPEVARRLRQKRRAIKRNATVGDVAAIDNWEKKWRCQRTVTCHWCRKRVKASAAHVDHVEPLSKGGKHALENLCVACAPCNLSKKDKVPEVWNTQLNQPLLFV